MSASERPCDWQCVQRTSHCPAADLEHMGINHGGRYVGVAEQVLHRPNITARLEEMGRETVTQSVRRGRFVDLRGPDCARLKARWKVWSYM